MNVSMLHNVRFSHDSCKLNKSRLFFFLHLLYIHCLTVWYFSLSVIYDNKIIIIMMDPNCKVKLL